jgi:EAL domain-containing protein (putative c-di-GMP-specific phosphodiesterase class I)
VRTIVTLAANLGVSAVAEGVETPAQAAQLRSFHCPYAQGFLFSRPVAAREAAALLRSRTIHG